MPMLSLLQKAASSHKILLFPDKYNVKITYMKKYSFLFLYLLICHLGKSQTWSGTTPGDIYYNQGNVGIGLSTPSTLLEVYNATLTANTVGSTTDIAIFRGRTPNAAKFKFLLQRNEINGDWQNVSGRLQFVTDVSTQGYLEFNPLGGSWGMALGSSLGEIMRLTSDGRIGIGTSTPEGKLTIGGPNGNIFITNNFFEGYNGIWLNGSSNSVDYNLLSTASDKNLYINRPAGAGIYFRQANIDQMTITESGNVGIGTTSPGSYKLAVEGTMGARKVKVTQSAWADYVFEPAYKLPPLEEVEAFIKQHGHLRNVPTAKEVADEGLDLGGNQAVLLAKIEELTLYVIEQNKQNKEQQQLIKQQQEQLDQQRKEILRQKEVTESMLERLRRLEL